MNCLINTVLKMTKKTTKIITKDLYDKVLNAIQLDSRTKCDDGAKFKYWCKNQFKVETIGARNLLYCSKTSLPVTTKEETAAIGGLVINRISNWPNQNMNFQRFLSGLCRSGICLAK